MLQLNIYYKKINIQMMRLRNSFTISGKFPLASFPRCFSKYNKKCFLNSYPSCRKNKCSQYEKFTEKVLKHVTHNTHRANRLDQFFTVPSEHKMKNKIASHIPGKLSINIINNIMITKVNILVMNSLPVYTRWNTGQK